MNDELEKFGSVLNFSKCANRGLALGFKPPNHADCYRTWQSHGISALCLAASNVSSYQIPPPATPSPPLNCTSHNSANWPCISSRTITVVADLCQAAKLSSRVSWRSRRIFTIPCLGLLLFDFVLFSFFLKVSFGLPRNCWN